MYRRIRIFLTLFSKGLKNQNKKSGANHKTIGSNEKNLLLSHLINRSCVFWEKSETVVDWHCISLAFVLNRSSSQRKMRSMGTASRDSNKIYLSSEIIQRSVLNKDKVGVRE